MDSLQIKKFLLIFERINSTEELKKKFRRYRIMMIKLKKVTVENWAKNRKANFDTFMNDAIFSECLFVSSSRNKNSKYVFAAKVNIVLSSPSPFPLWPLWHSLIIEMLCFGYNLVLQNVVTWFIPFSGIIRMLPGTDKPLECSTANSCTYVNTPNCVMSPRYGYKVCCSTMIC